MLNGPPASGKSTMAARYADDHPLTLNLDIDQIRALLGAWRSDPHVAGLLARGIALSAARTHLHAGHDVIIPQLVARPGFLDQLERLAAETAAEFHELVLLSDKETTLRRYAERGTPADSDPAELSEMYDRLLAFLPTRPAATVIPTRDGELDQTYRDLLAAL
jgi:predicted kinase